MFMLFLGLLLFFQPMLTTNLSNAQNLSDITTFEIQTTATQTIKQDIGAGGEEQLISNVVQNSGFEETNANGGPAHYNYYGSAFQYVNPAYTVEKYAGTYACNIQGYGSEQFSASTYLFRNLDIGPTRAYLQENIDFDFWIYMVQNPDVLNGGNIYLRLRFIHEPSSTSYYMYYYFSSLSIPANSGNNAYFNASLPFLSWENFQRDITSDFTAIFGSAAQVYLAYMYLYCQSPADPIGITEVIVDDFSVENSTAYNYCSDNAGFEMGSISYWSDNSQGYGSVYQTDDHTEGSKAINITATTPLGDLEAYGYVENYFGQWNDPPLGFYANDFGDFTIQYDWKYSETIGAFSSQYAAAYLYGYNGSFSFSAYWFLGEVSDTIIWSNYSSSTSRDLYFAADGFGERDVWNTFNLDVYEVASAFDIIDMPYLYYGFQVYSGPEIGSTTQLLLDNFRINTYPTGDPSFEEDWDFTAVNPIPSWEDSASDPYLSFTSDAHSGDSAANLTATTGSANVDLYRYTYVPLVENLYTDFWYRLDKIEENNQNYAYINIELDTGDEIYYMLGSSTLYNPSNSSSDVYFYIESYNQTGEWLNVVRNIAGDVEAAFGPGIYVIDQVRFRTYALGGSVTSLILDDIHFVLDSTGPQLVSQLLLNTPTYYQDALIEIFAVDTLSRVSNVRVYYRTDASWTYVTASPMGMNFMATIPMFDYGTTIEYYFEMYDMFGKSNTDDNGGSYYTYSIVDDVNPIVNILHVNTSSNQGIESVEIEASDIGSGIAYILLYDTGELIGNITTEPYNYIYNASYKQADGQRHLIAEAFDFAGNVDVSEMLLGVDLPSGFVSFFQSWGTLVGAGIVGAAWITVVLIKVFRKPKT